MNDIVRLINEANKIAILTHISEDADAVGTASALSEALSDLGKHADIYISEPLEDRLAFMNVCAHVYDGAAEEYDLCICVDCADLKRLGDRIGIFNSAKHTVSIDHHMTNDGYAEANLVNGDASAAAEVLYGLLRHMNITITPKIAFYLYTAIASDSGCFKYSSVSPSTMRIAADLLEAGIDNAYICRMLFDTEKKEVMQLEGYLMQNIEEYAGGKICVVSLSAETANKFGVEEKNTGDIVNIPRRSEGCEIAVSVREAKGKIKISLRSNGICDVAKTATCFGGGGHKRAAGITLENIGLEEAKRRIAEACIKEIEENNL